MPTGPDVREHATKKVSLAAELSKRVAAFRSSLGHGHPATKNDLDLLGEVAGFLGRLAPDEDMLEGRLDRLVRKDDARELCEALDFAPSPVQLTALMGLDTASDRRLLIRELQAARGRR
ncbi:MAG TPA: hypothetical protein VKA46_00245 [Gemmataceae bacterium]|nr:hypothetical protein [Gemmataceae bacterium]